MRIKCTKDKWITCVMVTIFSGIMTYSLYSLEAVNFADLFNKTYGYMGFEDYDLFCVTLIKWILPQLIMILFWGNYLEENFIGNADLILTRTKNVKKYVARFSIELFFAVMVVCVIYDSTSYLIAYFLFGVSGIGITVCINMLLYFLYLYMIALAVNVMSIYIKAAYAVFAIIGIQVFLLGIVKLIYDGLINVKVYVFLPVSNVMFYLNESRFDMNQMLSVLYLVCFAAMMNGIAIMVLKNKEIL